MLAPIDRPVICPVVIGRGHNLALLDGILAATCRGEGQTLLLAGEAGVGKSRMVSEARERTAQHGLLVLQGNCFETDRSFPYAPILDMLRSFLATESEDHLAGYWKPYAPELVKLLPELQARFPGLTPTTPLDPEQEKRRLFDTICAFLNSLSAANPLLVVIEDLHWADDTSLDFLLYMARRVVHKPLFLLMTYRSDEVKSLSRFLAALDRERLSSEMRLNRLPINEVDLMIRVIFNLKRPLHREFLETIYSLTEGNAFFIEEVLKSLTSAGDIFYIDGEWEQKPVHELHIPRSVHDAVQRRVEGLSKEARHVLALAAVVGRGFDFALLEALTGYEEQMLLGAIKELIVAQLVVEETADRFAFRHALTRQTIYSDLLGRERKSLHRTIAETMLNIYASSLDSHVADLSYHCFEAGMWPDAMEYSRLAGENARALHAPKAAVEQFTRGLRAATRLGVDPPASLYRSRGLEYEMLGEFDLALRDYEAALAISSKEGATGGEWEALLSLGMLWTGRDYGKAGAYYNKALDLAKQHDNPSMLAHSLNRLGNLLLNTEQQADGLQYHIKALEIFEKLQDHEGMATTLDLLGMTSYMTGDLFAGTAYYLDAIDLFEKIDNRPGLVSSLATLSMRGPTYHTDTMAARSSLLEAAQDGERALRIARQIAQRSGEAYALIFLGFCLGPAGEYSRALELAIGGLKVAEEIDHLQWTTAAHCAIGATYLDIFSADSARSHLEQAQLLAHRMGSAVWIVCSAAYLARAYILLGNLDGAKRVLDGALGDETLPESSVRALGQRMAWCARLELALAAGNTPDAIKIATHLIESAPGGEDYPIPRLWWLLAEALLRSGGSDRLSRADQLLQKAEETAHRQGAISLLWRINVTWGRVLRALERRKDATSRFAAARDIVARLAAGISDAALRDSFLNGANTVIPTAPPASQRRVEKAEHGGLTVREHEVALLVAQGKSNTEIAEILVVGKRTVETFVSEILSKLGLRSRQQVVKWVLERGLLDAQKQESSHAENEGEDSYS